MVMAKKFRRPEEIKPNEERVPVSLRLRSTLRERLTKEAKAAKLSLAELLENVLEDYARFLDS
jgi:predicted HicB family RNase H-like nuclease